MKSKNYFSRIAFAIVFLFAIKSNANNLIITGTSVSGSDVTFNISWSNSWNASLAPANWDAVWVFVKYQDCNTRLWNHANLSTNSGDHTAGSPLQVDTVTDGRGVFIRRSAVGGGNISPTSITLKMNIPAGTYNYKVFGIEMVNIPQGDFQIGDGASTGTYNSITINSAAQSGGLTAATVGGSSAAVPATYPMGFNSFYCMKYEVSQEQYVEFLNSLTYDQQRARTTMDPISAAGTYPIYNAFYYRTGIRIITPGNNNTVPAVYACDATPGVENNSNDGQNIPMTNLSWADLAAYLDWAALRPMTEFEFEKVCRGPLARVASEYAWGTTAIVAVNSNQLTNPLQPTEVYSGTAANGLCSYGLGSAAVSFGPLRCGIFATSSSGRASSGASYYGAMEMSGSVRERVVATNAAGVTYNGTLGDGTITALGEANQASWPSSTTAVGIGARGGNWVSVATEARVSDRSAVATEPDRVYVNGGRGVR